MKKIRSKLLKLLSKASVFTGSFGTFLFGFTVPVFAETGQSWLPSYIQEAINAFGFGGSGGDPIEATRQRVQWGLTVLFVAVFIVAIVYSALAAIKFISSQGDASKLEESKAAVKAILMGFAAMLVSIIGIFFIVWIFNQSSTIETDVESPGWD